MDLGGYEGKWINMIKIHFVKFSKIYKKYLKHHT